VSLDFRVPSEEELRPAMTAASAAFGVALEDDDFTRESKSLPRDRLIAAFDDGSPVGLAGAYDFELTIPGGALSAPGVTWVGVLPTHRRRGILRELMRRQLNDVHERGEALAILWASEAAIYGRFGYGLAAPSAGIEADRARFGLRDDPGPRAVVRLLEREHAFQVFPGVYERVRPDVPGMLSRTEHWWREHKLADPESWRQGAGPKFYAVIELDGAAEAYAMYRVKEEWEQGLPRGEVRVVEAFATSVGAARDLWRFLFSIDLTTQVKVWHLDPGSPLMLMVTDLRSLHLRLGDGLWLRLVDVEAALHARSWAADDSLVLEVRDELCDWNAGRWRVGDEVKRTNDEPDLALDVADLACAYLGAFDFERLRDAERVVELTPGAVARASALFRTPRPPFCPEVF
jgi:predicted acetyltransferase